MAGNGRQFWGPGLSMWGPLKMDVLYGKFPVKHSKTAWWLTYPSEKCIKCEIQLGKKTLPTEWKNKIHVPNHQPENDVTWMIWGLPRL